MELSEIKERASKLNIPWKVTETSAYCPLFMENKDGHLIMGRNFYEQEYEDIWTEIVNFNRRVKVFEDYVEILSTDNKTRIKLLKLL